MSARSIAVALGRLREPVWHAGQGSDAIAPQAVGKRSESGKARWGRIVR
jgi:hypothetical protein